MQWTQCETNQKGILTITWESTRVLRECSTKNERNKTLFLLYTLQHRHQCFNRHQYFNQYEFHYHYFIVNLRYMESPINHRGRQQQS